MFYCFKCEMVWFTWRKCVAIAHQFLELWECRVTLLDLYPFVESWEGLKFHSSKNNLTLGRESFLSHCYKVILSSLNLFTIITCLFSQAKEWKGPWTWLMCSFLRWSLDCLILLILFGLSRLQKETVISSSLFIRVN